MSNPKKKIRAKNFPEKNDEKNKRREREIERERSEKKATKFKVHSLMSGECLLVYGCRHIECNFGTLFCFAKNHTIFFLWNEITQWML